MSDYRPQVGDVVRRQGQSSRWIVRRISPGRSLVLIERDSVVTSDWAWIEPAELEFLHHDESDVAS